MTSTAVRSSVKTRSLAGCDATQAALRHRQAQACGQPSLPLSGRRRCTPSAPADIPTSSGVHRFSTTFRRLSLGRCHVVSAGNAPAQHVRRVGWLALSSGANRQGIDAHACTNGALLRCSGDRWFHGGRLSTEASLSGEPEGHSPNAETMSSIRKMRDASKIGRGGMDKRTRGATGATIALVLSLRIADEKALMTRDTETAIDRHTGSGLTMPAILKSRHGITAASTRSAIGMIIAPVWTGVVGTEPSVHGPGDRRVCRPSSSISSAVASLSTPSGQPKQEAALGAFPLIDLLTEHRHRSPSRGGRQALALRGQSSDSVADKLE